MTVGSLFSGIGGIELGLERTGNFKTIWNCEIDPWASAVLKKHWPGAENFGDITKVDWAAAQRPDLICGGFPCQDISQAGRQAGLREGKRSGLWYEFAKAIRVLRPRYVLVENVPALAYLGLDVVLADLASAGYDAEWQIVSAASVGAPHLRERVFVVAYTSGLGCGGANKPESRIFGASERQLGAQPTLPGRGIEDNLADSGGKSCGLEKHRDCRQGRKPPIASKPEILRQEDRAFSSERTGADNQNVPNPHDSGRQEQRLPISDGAELSAAERIRWWQSEPNVGRVAHGVPHRVDRLKCLGNAVVPQVAQVIGEMILEFDAHA